MTSYNIPRTLTPTAHHLRRRLADLSPLVSRDLTWETRIAAEAVRIVNTLETLAGDPVTVADGVRVDVAVTVTLAARLLIVRLAEPAVDADVALVTWRGGLVV